MKPQKQLLAVICLFFCAGLVSNAQTAPLWMRYPTISPDGTHIAFEYKGGIYKVPASGGQAERLASGSEYSYCPVWAPDGRTIAFAGNRYGNFDVFTMSSEGGSVKRLTTNSAAETPYSFSPDGKSVFFGAMISKPAQSALSPISRLGELYSVSVNGGRPHQILSTPAEDIRFMPDGKSFLYQDQKGFENAWRKHHTSSITRDIWLYDPSEDSHKRITSWKGEDRNPCLSPDGKTLFYLSERSGSFNVWTMPVDGSEEQARQLTKYKDNPVRFLSISSDGTLCYGYNGSIYTLRDGRQAKVRITVKDEDALNKDKYISVKGGSSQALSPDGKQVAFVSRGEIFVTAVEYPTTKQITHTPAAETDPTFSDDRTLAYASERGGRWDIYVAKIVRDEDPNFPNATLLDEKPLLKDASHERTSPKYSPDGKRIAFVQDREKLMILDVQSGKLTQLTDGSTMYDTDGSLDYSWSPDGKWIAMSYTGNKHDPYTDIGIVSCDGGEIHNITNTGYFDQNPIWSADGNVIIFASDRYGMRSHASWGSLQDIMAVALNRKAFERYNMSKEEAELAKKASSDKPDEKSSDKSADKAKKVEDIVIEFDNIDERIVRLTQFSGSLGSAVLDKDGTKLFYTARYGDSSDLWEMDLRERSTKIIQKSVNARELQWDSKYANLFIFGGGMSYMKGGSGTPKSISAKSELALDSKAEREYIFDKIYRDEKERFYSEEMHDVNWDALYKNYRQFLPDIDNDMDFAEMASELLGELNVSHTGCRYTAPTDADGDVTAELGLLFDSGFAGDGLKVDEVLAMGPFDKSSSSVERGDILERIDGQAIKAGEDYYPLLNRKAGEKTLVSFFRPSDGKRWEEVTKPISKSALSALLYKRWVKRNADEVQRLSGGRLGYVHIQSMDDGSYRTIYADVLGKYNQCDGIVIDTRFNGGGRLHEDVEILFSGHKYLTQVVRGKEACDMPSRRSNKPSVMITCEANYSNAHGTPWVYQHQGLGKVVGMPVPGTMTSVNWVRTQNPALVFGIPVVGYRTAEGNYLENTQLEPDLTVRNPAEEISRGTDRQLEAAVKSLLSDLK